ncbi:uncharacterized protein AB675_8340 [Cyphellophora attinorum]|uniref:Uncharacterized protein n=1 Tax=Cyphellophora attinorum TaxID=1664694 RepID=A0A0N1HG80_9EURO|nr:uncharacterized protein AB675_8340 [Phialophora attinorum]KPI44537.1 hypothetical protein AB675_8340 [Phialophora attinorum]
MLRDVPEASPSIETRVTAFFNVTSRGTAAESPARQRLLVWTGVSQARVWRLVSQQVDDYGAVTIDHSNSSRNDLLTDATVLRILQLGSACKSLCWAAITDVQDSLFYNRTSLDLHAALEFSFTKLRQFELVFGPRMDHIAKDFLLLDEKSQLGYIWLVIHFHLGILILADALDVGLAETTLEEDATIAKYKLGAVRGIANIINLVRQFDNLNPQQSSLLLRDPYPEHASTAMLKAAESVVGLMKTQVITTGAASVLASSIMQGLRIVAQISYSAEQAQNNLPSIFQESGVPLASNGGAHGRANPVPTVLLDSAVTPEMLGNETLRELRQQAESDPRLVLKTIERHEIPDSTTDFGLDYLQYIDFSTVAANWEFDDVFAGS